MQTCPRCRSLSSPAATVCSHCGAPLAQQAQPPIVNPTTIPMRPPPSLATSVQRGTIPHSPSLVTNNDATVRAFDTSQLPPPPSNKFLEEFGLQSGASRTELPSTNVTATPLSHHAAGRQDSQNALQALHSSVPTIDPDSTMVTPNTPPTRPPSSSYPMLGGQDLVEEDDPFGGPTTYDLSDLSAQKPPRRYIPDDDMLGDATTFDAQSPQIRQQLQQMQESGYGGDATFIQPGDAPIQMPTTPGPMFPPPAGQFHPLAQASQANDETSLNQTPPKANLLKLPQTGAPRDPSQDQLIGQQFGNFRIDQRIGRGGFGAIYRATQIYLQQPIAIKVLHVNLQQHPQILERFRREAKALARLNHENVVQLSDFGVLPGLGFYLAMEYLEGKSLHRRLKAGETFSLQRTRNVIRQLTHVLDYVHKKGVIHRDMKPSNIILVEDEIRGELLKLIDFGISSLQVEIGALTREGSNLGTAKYMAPEQVQGHTHIDGRSDLYSVGIILYRLLTGELPFHGNTEMEYLQHQVRTPPPPLKQKAPQRAWAPSLESFMQYALAKAPETRPQNAEEFWTHFSEAINDQFRLERGEKQTSNNHWLFWLLGCVLLGGIVAAAWTLWPTIPEEPTQPKQVSAQSNPTPHPQTPTKPQPTPRENSIAPPPITRRPVPKRAQPILPPKQQCVTIAKQMRAWRNKHKLHMGDLGSALNETYNQARQLYKQRKYKEASTIYNKFRTQLQDFQGISRIIAYEKYKRLWAALRSHPPAKQQTPAYQAIRQQMIQTYTAYYKTQQYTAMSQAMNKLFRKLNTHPKTSKPLK